MVKEHVESYEKLIFYKLSATPINSQSKVLVLKSLIQKQLLKIFNLANYTKMPEEVVNFKIKEQAYWTRVAVVGGGYIGDWTLLKAFGRLGRSVQLTLVDTVWMDTMIRLLLKWWLSIRFARSEAVQAVGLMIKKHLM